MKKRFALLLDSCTKEQEEAVRVYVEGLGVGWWHWLPNVWLVTQSTGTLRAEKLRDDLVELLPNMTLLVLELGDTNDSWNGFGPTGKGKDFFTWLRKNWTKST